MRIKALLGATLIAAISWTAMPTHAAFPGPNGKIAYASYPRADALEEIYTVNPDGTGRTRLTFRPTDAIQSSVAPAVSPDGTMIAFHRYNADTDISDLVIIESTAPAGTPATEIDSYPAPPNTNYAWPSWSPDSSHLVFARATSAGGGNQDIYVLDVATGTVTQVTFTAAYEAQPQWSPDGTQIAFVRQVGDGKVFVADIDPTTFALTHVTNVTGPGPMFSDGSPKWHPTQNKIVLNRFKSGWGGSEIFVENLATGTQKRHTNNSVYDSMPAYSPDGMFFVYSRGPEDEDSELIKQNVASGSKTIVTSNRVVDQQADWGVQPTIVP